MNIKSILVRLQSSINRDDLIEQMLLLPGQKTQVSGTDESSKSVNLLVGYNGSPGSHAALDIALLIAHQTRLATSKQVTVQVVYVIEENQSSDRADAFGNDTIDWMPLEVCLASEFRTATPVLTETKFDAPVMRSQIALVEPYPIETTFSRNNSFEQADSILWQARCLFEQWRDSFAAHLRFGSIATELKQIVESEAADILFLGCNSFNHPIVKKLGANFPCSVLGISDCVDD
ncbi:universal stress protein [Argonema antarcticum]|uniref:universal stress protein n=1 Tax=Argonema antarcticum TaxID=2942763 RepID=UPI0020114261|nr:universal stress protein [Argonema antarcticum A004/B2]